jgi:PAS domain S-box-containing protein
MPQAKVLLVDDDLANLHAMSAMLGDLGAQIIETSSGEAALEILAQSNVALVLLDMELADMTGMETAQRIKNNEWTAYIPIIFLTAHTSLQEEIYAVGAVDYLVKPVLPGMLRAKVSTFLQLDKKNQELDALNHELKRQLDAVARLSDVITTQAGIAKQREYLYVTLKSIGDAVITTDAQGRVTLLNGVAETLTGWQQGEAVGKHLSEIFKIVDEVTHRPVDNPVDTVHAEGRSVALPNHTLLISRNGERIAINDSAAPIRDDSGTLLGVVLVFRDVTEVKKARAALEESEQRFRDIADTAPVLIWISDASALCTYFNKPWLDFTGRTLVEELGNGWAEGVHPDDYERCLDTYLSAFAARQPFEMEYRLRRADGQYRWIYDKAVPRFTGQGDFVGFIGSCSDITHTKRVENQHRFLAEASRIFASSLDYDTTIRRLTEISFTRFGDLCIIYSYTPQGTIEPVLIAHSEPDKEALARQVLAKYPIDPDGSYPVAQTLRSGISVLIPHITDELLIRLARDVDHLSAFRSVGLQSYMCVPLISRKRVIAAMTIFSIRSERIFTRDDLALAEELAQRAGVAMDNALLYKERETLLEQEHMARLAAEEAIHNRDEFLLVAAHELKTPITSLRGFAELLIRQMNKTGSLDPAHLQRALKVIDTQSIKLSRLIEQLLDVSGIHEGKLPLQLQLTDIVSLIRDVVSRSRVDTTEHPIMLHGVPSLEVTVDPWRMEQVMINLLDNAVKYSPEGGKITVDVSVREIGTFTITVQDEGMGVPEDQRPSLFERFHQAHRQHHLGGLGLGLYITRRIVEQHGGTIRAQFPPEGGSTFIITLPIHPLAETD